MPRFLHALLDLSRRRPLLFLLGSGVAGWLVYWQLAPSVPRPPSAPVKAQAIPGLGTERAVMEKTLLDVQQHTAQLRGSLEEQQRAVQQIHQALTAAERERQAADVAQERRLQEMLSRTQQMAQVQPPPAPAPRPQLPALPTPAPKVTPVSLPQVPSGDRTAKVRILRSEKPASFAGLPPFASRADIPFLPAGSYAEGRLVTGVFATSRVGGALPVLFAVTKTFYGPFQLGGPGVRPLPTALPLDGCLMLGKAQADLASSRVIVQLDTLSCVYPDGSTFERAIRGYATGYDGTLGLIGRLETQDAAYLARTFLTSLLAGAAEAFAVAKRTVIVTPFGGTHTTTTGHVGETAGFAALAHAAARLSDFYLQQAERLMPVLWVESHAAARLVLQEGLSLDDLPTSTVVYSRGIP